jgi:hypothetical protein
VLHERRPAELGVESPAEFVVASLLATLLCELTATDRAENAAHGEAGNPGVLGGVKCPFDPRTGGCPHQEARGPSEKCCRNRAPGRRRDEFRSRHPPRLSGCCPGDEQRQNQTEPESRHGRVRGQGFR